MNFHRVNILMLLLLRLVAINLLLAPFLAFGYTITSSNDHRCEEYFHSKDNDRKVKYCYSGDNLFTTDIDDTSRSGYVTITYLGKKDITVPVTISNHLGRKAILHSRDVGTFDREILDRDASTVQFDFLANDDNDNSKTLFINGERNGIYNHEKGIVRIKVDSESEKDLNYRSLSNGESFCRIYVVDAVGGMYFPNGKSNSKINPAVVRYDTNTSAAIRFSVRGVRYASGKNKEFNTMLSVSEDAIKQNTKEIYYRHGPRSHSLSDYVRANILDSIDISGSGLVSFIPIVDVNEKSLMSGKYVMRSTITCN
ncbi:hypothetical protein SX4_0923 [Vibrio mimicus SX-4]|uniref:Uncharacterized protein n=2 Tax=Vibrio mimicus TaxID=674 RepID=A0A2J9UWI7_VIBMI|nr:hypothetical protein VMD_19900 [Vibrio mimicus VM573]EGU18245.1 hypothetical protein SX4_0923 [Vibrio mimicus SX-4]KFE30008.1 hypothetical protein DN31_3251 [Vibrio mimicus]PNM55889.1 hypothetical protein AL544_007305 [Vibrio mimicus]